jgi:hypothetical protein
LEVGRGVGNGHEGHRVGDRESRQSEAAFLDFSLKSRLYICNVES